MAHKMDFPLNDLVEWRNQDGLLVNIYELLANIKSIDARNSLMCLNLSSQSLCLVLGCQSEN